MKYYSRCKTTTGHKYYLRRCEDEVLERMTFHTFLVILPVLSVFAFAAAAGVLW